MRRHLRRRLEQTSAHSGAASARTASSLRWCAVFAGVALVLGLTACSSDESADAGSTTSAAKSSTTAAVKNAGTGPIANAITITSPGMSFEVSGDLRPGIAAITFDNTDSATHMLQVSRLKDGVTLEQVKQAATANDEAAANDLLADGIDATYGTPAPLGPGQKSTVIAPDLKAGNYAILCFMTTDDGTPHVALGMVNEFTVKGEPATEEPETTAAISVDDSRFTMPEGFNGSGTFKVTNSGTKPHDMQLVRIDEGSTLESYFTQVGAIMNTNTSVDSAKGGAMAGGITTLAPGQSAWLVLDLPAGHYGYLSTVDAQSGPPSQMGEFTVS